MGMLTEEILLSTLGPVFESNFCYCHVKTTVRWVEFLKISFSTWNLNKIIF